MEMPALASLASLLLTPSSHQSPIIALLSFPIPNLRRSHLDAIRTSKLPRHIGSLHAIRTQHAAYECKAAVLAQAAAKYDPLASEWIEIAQKDGWVVLLDIAAYCPTNAMDLSKIQPGVCSVSCYKMFGYPSGVGCLLVRKPALKLIAQRPWFAAETVQMVYPDGRPMMMPVDAPDRWEDGTVAFSAMAAVPIGLRHLEQVGVHNISKRSKCLAGWTMNKMMELRHPNATPMCMIHGPTDMRGRGGTICFNLLNEQGALLSMTQVSGLAETAGIMIRAGCMCNPHGAWHALSTFTVQQLRGWDPDLLPGKAPTDQVSMKELVASVEKHSDDCGCCRISFGIVSTFADAQAAVGSLQSFIMSGPTGPASPIRTVTTQNLAWLKSIAPNGLSKHKSIIPQGLLGLDSALSIKAVLVDLSVPAS